MNRNLLQHLVEAWKRWPQEEKIVDEERAVSLSSLLQEIATVRKEIASKFDDKTETIGILLPSSIAFISAFFGTIAAGKLPVLLNFLLTPRELAAIIDHAECRLVITAPDLKPLLQETAKHSSLAFNTVTADHILSACLLLPHI